MVSALFTQPTMLTRAIFFLGLLASFTIAQVSTADQQTFLQAHNTVRSQHGAAPLVWSSTLAQYAQRWAADCSMTHSGGPYGENLAMGYTISSAVQAWAAEASAYDPKSPVYSHFTQVVWKSTTQLGCGVQLCESSRYIVCEYNPPGNVRGQFGQNVDP